MEKQQKPQSCGSNINSIKLWIVLLIQRRRCDKSTLYRSGA